MPSSRAILHDLYQNELDPSKPHARIRNGRLVKPAACAYTNEVVERQQDSAVKPEPASAEDNLAQGTDVSVVENIEHGQAKADEQKKHKHKRSKVLSTSTVD